MFNKYNFLIKDFCGKENTARPELSGIFCEPNRTTATDSFALISVSIPQGLKIEDYLIIPNKPKPLSNFKPFILPSTEAEKLIKPLSRKVSLPILENAVVFKSEKGVIEVGTSDLQSFDGICCRPVIGEYPKFQDLLVERGNFIEIEVNPDFLKKIATFFSKFSDKKTMKIKVPVKPDKPIRFYGKKENQTAVAILMPIKSSD